MKWWPRASRRSATPAVDRAAARRWSRRQRLTPVALAVGVAASLLMTGGVASTYAAFTATITNSDSAGTGSLVMQQSHPTGAATQTCTSTDDPSNSSTCNTDLYGGSVGDLGRQWSFKAYNTGSLSISTFQVSFGACSPLSNPLSTPGSVCDSVAVTITCRLWINNAATGGTFRPLNSVPLSTVATQEYNMPSACNPPPGPASDGNYAAVTVTTGLAPNTGTEAQGQTARQPISWRFTAGQ